jgi:DNA-binding NtrC family response regulator
MKTILVVDDERKIRALLSERLAEEGYGVAAFESAERALDRIAAGGIDIVLCDLRLGGMDGLELLKRAKRKSPATDFVIMTAYASASTAVEAMREGAYEYLIKPFQMDEVLMLMRRISERRDLISENTALRDRIAQQAAPGGRIIGESAAIASVRDLIGKVAAADTPVLILGESGTGKELVAEAIHAGSGRADKPFIPLNCAAVPETLLEAELFGYEKGAFTGAAGRKPGQFKLADGGTLFLDEIGELPLSLQAKLLRAIENGEFLPLGGARPVTVDVRILAATNRDIEARVRDGSFREDLYYRLNVFPISVPPLRERKGDIAQIAAHFLISWHATAPSLSQDVIDKLKGYAWPGNVRELRNILERATILAGAGPIESDHIMITGAAPGDAANRLRSLVGEKTLSEIEEEMIRHALEAAGGNKSRAAELLGITRRTLYSRLERLGRTVADETEDEKGDS